MGRKRLKSLRSDILLDRKVVASGTQILPHRHHPHSPFVYVLHHCSDLLNLLTQADHQSGLADYPSLACRPPEHTQGPLVIRLRPYCSIQTQNCLHIVVEYVRFSLQNYINCRALPSKVRHQHLNDGIRQCPSHGPYGRCKMGSPTIQQVITGDGSDDHIAEIHLSSRIRNLGRFFRVQSGWPRMIHSAETTVPGALITHYQECRRTSLEALALVGTERAFTDGMQILGRRSLSIPPIARALGRRFFSHSGFLPAEPSTPSPFSVSTSPISLTFRPAPPSSPATSTADVNRFAVDVVTRLHHRLSYGRMSVNGVSHILDGKALAHGHSDLMNQVCDVRTHHVRTQDLVRLLIRNYLDIAHVLPNGHGLAGRPQTEGTRHGFEALFACLALGEANTSYLRHGIDTTGNYGQITFLIATEAVLHSHQSFSRSNMGKQDAAVDIADGVDALHGCLQPNVLKTDVLGIRSASDGNQHLLCSNLIPTLQVHGDGIVPVVSNALYLAFEHHIDALLAEDALELLGKPLILKWKHLRHHLNHSYVSSQLREDGGKFATNHSGTDNQQRLRNLLHLQRSSGVQDSRLAEVKEGKLRRLGSSGDYDLVRSQRLHTVRSLHFHSIRRDNATLTNQ